MKNPYSYFFERIINAHTHTRALSPPSPVRYEYSSIDGQVSDLSTQTVAAGSTYKGSRAKPVRKNSFSVGPRAFRTQARAGNHPARDSLSALLNLSRALSRPASSRNRSGRLVEAARAYIASGFAFPYGRGASAGQLGVSFDFTALLPIYSTISPNREPTTEETKRGSRCCGPVGGKKGGLILSHRHRVLKIDKKRQRAKGVRRGLINR